MQASLTVVVRLTLTTEEIARRERSQSEPEVLNYEA
jgi:hypothetical protein